jgi:hypothetical protein
MAYIIEQNKVFREVDMLSRADQFYLLSYLAKSLAKSEVPKYNLTSLKGLGKGLWTENGVDNFISKERASWD